MDIARIRKKLKKQQTSGENDSGDVSKEDKAARHVEDVVEQPPVVSKKEESPEPVVLEKDADSGDSGVSVEEEELVEEIEILAFKVSNEEYAVKISDLQEVLRPQRITYVPRAPEYLLGITSVRGKILPVVDMRKRLNLVDKSVGKEKIIILSGEKAPIGIKVGSVLDVYRFPENELLPPPSTLNDEEKSFIDGVVKIKNKFISVLKVDEILKTEEL